MGAITQLEDELNTPVFTSRNPDTGLLETRHAITGEIIAIQESLDDSILKSKASKAIVVKVNGHDMLVEAGVNPDSIKKMGAKRAWVYSTMIGETITQMISEGMTLTEICKMKGYPRYNTICRWRHENSSFDEMIRLAFRSRAEWHRDRAIQIAEENVDTRSDAIGGAKMAVETHKWAASTDHSERFGAHKNIKADINVATKFIIDTGIRRPDDPGYNKDQTKLMHEKDVTEILKPKED